MIRKAVLDDVRHIHALLQFDRKQGEGPARPLSQLYNHIRDFWVFEDPETRKLAGCCALQFCWEDLAEIRSLTVDQTDAGRGIASTLTERAMQEAFYFKIKKVFTRTRRPEFFSRFGFVAIDTAELQMRVWSDCIRCVSSPDCDDTAMLKTL